ncbi:MAG: helix-turn-helix domain-containing protein [Acidimicrobiia bacterium]
MRVPEDSSDPVEQLKNPLVLHSSGPPSGNPPQRVAVVDGTLVFDRAAYDQTEAAELIGGVTRQHVAKMIRDGEIRAKRLGRRVVISAAEIARVVNG